MECPRPPLVCRGGSFVVVHAEGFRDREGVLRSQPCGPVRCSPRVSIAPVLLLFAMAA